ncbi:MAG: hypothetical protein ACTSUE_02020, partial [Promethearchaeota archaeon]
MVKLVFNFEGFPGLSILPIEYNAGESDLFIDVMDEVIKKANTNLNENVIEVNSIILKDKEWNVIKRDKLINTVSSIVLDHGREFVVSPMLESDSKSKDFEMLVPSRRKSEFESAEQAPAPPGGIPASTPLPPGGIPSTPAQPTPHPVLPSPPSKPTQPSPPSEVPASSDKIPVVSGGIPTSTPAQPTPQPSVQDSNHLEIDEVREKEENEDDDGSQPEPALKQSIIEPPEKEKEKVAVLEKKHKEERLEDRTGVKHPPPASQGGRIKKTPVGFGKETSEVDGLMGSKVDEPRDGVLLPPPEGA